MAHYLVTIDDTDDWGDQRYKFRSEGDARFEEELPRQPLVRLLRWDDYHLTELRRGSNGVEGEARGYIGHFPAVPEPACG